MLPKLKVTNWLKKYLKLRAWNLQVETRFDSEGYGDFVGFVKSEGFNFLLVFPPSDTLCQSVPVLIVEYNGSLCN